MSVNLRAIQIPTAASHAQAERTQQRGNADARQDFAALLQQEAASPAAASDTRRPGAPGTPQVTTPDPVGRSLPSENGGNGNLAADGNEVATTGTLSDDPRTQGMYVPPDFYHGSSYSPVFDHQDENGKWVPTPRFEGQVVLGPWRGTLPADWDPNARVQHDPLSNEQSYRWWKQDESGNWVKRETGYGGIPLDDDGKPMFTPDPVKYPEYFAADPGSEET